MNVTKYKLEKDAIILGVLFLKGEIVYIEHYDPVGGRPQRVFKENKDLIGRISSDFWGKLDEILIKEEDE